MGQQVGETNTATGIEQAVSGSYMQMEVHFTEHSDYLMPRVHQMRTDLAQYYNSTNPSIRLQYSTSEDENINFAINGRDLLLRDINVYASTNVNIRSLIERIKQMALENNTTGATIYELGTIMQESSLSAINKTLKLSQQRLENKTKEEQEYQERLSQQRIDATLKEKEMALMNEAIESEKNRQSQERIAKIRAAGMAAMVDLNENNQSDFIDIMDNMSKTDEFQQRMSLENNKMMNDKALNKDRMNIEREKLIAQQQLKQMDLEVARENQTKAELVAKGKLKDKNMKKK
jgi:hypothetical protein